MPINLMILMGVSGCGKSTIGRRVSDKLGWQFIDADDLHPESNRQKMSASIPLNDADREPWLAAICQRAEEMLSGGQSLIVGCSALKRSYRDHLRSISCPLKFVHLHAAMNVIAARQANRLGHFMPADLLDSQYRTLEPPVGEPDVVEISVDQEMESVIDSVIAFVRER